MKTGAIVAIGVFVLFGFFLFMQYQHQHSIDEQNLLNAQNHQDVLGGILSIFGL